MISVSPVPAGAETGQPGAESVSGSTVTVNSGQAKEESIPVTAETTVLPPVQAVKETSTGASCVSLKLGVVLPLSGELADYGKKAKKGIDLAVRLYNKENKTDISTVYNDSESKELLKNLAPWGAPETPIEEFYKEAASDEKMVGIIGPGPKTSAVNLAKLAGIYAVPTISPLASGSNKIKDAQYFYAAAVFPEDEGRNIAEFTVNVLKKKKTAVIYPKNNVYGTACAAAFKEEMLKLGGEVVREEAFEEGSYDFKEQMVNLGGIDPHVIKDTIAADKSNLESIIDKLVLQVRALLPEATEKKRNNIVLLAFTNTGRENELLADDFDFGRLISEKISYGLGKFKDTRLSKLAEVKEFVKKKGFDKAGLAKKFGAGIIISGAVSEKNPLSYNCRVTVEDLDRKSSAEVLFDFTASDKLVTNTYGLEAVYLPVSAYDAESLLSHLVFFELKVPYLGNSRLNDKKFIASVRQNEGELYFTAEFNAASNLPGAADFVRAYKSVYFEVPDYFSAAAYDTARIFLQAIAGGACSKEAVKTAVNNISTAGLVTGDITYDGTFLKKDLHIIGIKDKEVLELK